MRISFQTVLLLFTAIFVLGCSDSSPLKSDLEVAINKTYDMQFDYLDHVQVYKLGEDGTYKESLVELKGDIIRGIVLTLAKASETSEVKGINTYPYKIVLSTSREGMEYNKKQTSAELLVYPKGQATYLFYENRYYKLSGDDLKSYGIESALAP
ncbi:hypothetical protein CIG75_17535 [Tumebacillus algifaecis]|uniref:Lipoprotein n=1 Tax=Tumebacillus algifaecis TaxID=1214604 RepID=A0A223D547_9BACL|nr:hypothetical protein [Tumebacillus algifaecis]ASS76587.1 hypothetical protein CIG75_17535 [Tumebacillus algifaecis]